MYIYMYIVMLKVIRWIRHYGFEGGESIGLPDSHLIEIKESLAINQSIQHGKGFGMASHYLSFHMASLRNDGVS